jgi:hypothetical protein
MANNIKQIKAAIEANLATIRDAYYAALNSDSSPEGVETARANYATALKSAQLNALTLLNTQTPFEEGEYETTNAVLELGYPLSKVDLRKSSTPTTANIGQIYGISFDNSASSNWKLLTEYNSNVSLNEFVSSVISLTGSSLRDFLSNTTADGQSLMRAIQIDVMTGASGGTADTGGTGATGTSGDCGGVLECYDCCLTASNKGPNGEITLGDGTVVYPFDPITNPLGYIKESILCNKSYTRNKYIKCEGETGFTLVEEPGLSSYNYGEDWQEYEVPGYKPKPYYRPGYPDPNDPEIGRYNGPSVVGADQSSQYREDRCSYTDPTTGKRCEVLFSQNCYCSSTYVLEFSNWGMKPCSWTPQWTDGPPPPGWCDSIRNYILEHPELPICLPSACKNTVNTSGDGPIFIPIGE